MELRSIFQSVIALHQEELPLSLKNRKQPLPINKKSLCEGGLFLLVHLARIELARPCGQQILSLQRLPVPPQVHEIFFNTVYTYLLQ